MTNWVKEIIIRMTGQLVVAISLCILNEAFNREGIVFFVAYLFLWVAGWIIYDSHYKFKNL